MTNSRGEVIDSSTGKVVAPGVPKYPEELRGFLFPSIRDDRESNGWCDPEVQRMARLWADYCLGVMDASTEWEKMHAKKGIQETQTSQADSGNSGTGSD